MIVIRLVMPLDIRTRVAPLVVAGLLLPALACRPAPDAADAPSLTLSPCPPADNIEDGLCGRLEVFEDRAAAAGRRIRLRIVVLPALSGDPLPDALFFLAGGPGQAATELTEAIREPFRRVNRDRDLVFVDQRGTGGSNPLTCELDEDAPEDALLLDPLAEALLRDRAIAQVGRCLSVLDADPRFYTTPIAMDDLDDVRAAFGCEMINVWGGSYGTRAGLVYLRRHGEHVRSAILDGLAPVAMKLPLHMGRALTNVRHVTVPGAAQGTLGAGGVPDLMAEFVERGDARGLDTACVAEIVRPRFFDSPLGPDTAGGGS